MKVTGTQYMFQLAEGCLDTPSAVVYCLDFCKIKLFSWKVCYNIFISAVRNPETQDTQVHCIFAITVIGKIIKSDRPAYVPVAFL